MCAHPWDYAYGSYGGKFQRGDQFHGRVNSAFAPAGDTVAEGETIVTAGDFANRFYLIETGKVVLESDAAIDDPVLLETIGAGDLLGWSWIFPPYVWHFTARAIEPTTALFFYGTILREYCEKDPSLGYELFKRMSMVMVKRLQAARKQMLRLRVHDPISESGAAVVRNEQPVSP